MHEVGKKKDIVRLRRRSKKRKNLVVGFHDRGCIEFVNYHTYPLTLFLKVSILGSIKDFFLDCVFIVC